MFKIIFLFLLFPIYSYSQNIITVAYLTKDTSSIIIESDDYDIYKLTISPGYHDHDFKIELFKACELGNDSLLKSIEVKVKLIVHKKNFKMPGGKEEWDYETSVKSNEIISNEYFNIQDCSGKKNLICNIILKKYEKYSIILYTSESQKSVFNINK